MHRSAVGRPRAERIRQVREREASVSDFASYVPTEGTVARLAGWAASGAEIAYLSSHRRTVDVAADEVVLRAHGFPPGPVLHRRPGESYADVAARAGADVVVEDDCESIGGAREMVVPDPARAPGLRAVMVPEFGGLAHLPDSPASLG